MQMLETFKTVSTSVFFPKNVVKEHGNQLKFTKLGQSNKNCFCKLSLDAYKVIEKECLNLTENFLKIILVGLL